jgi:hypothetical protein
VPQDGRIGEVGARIGQYVSVGTQLLAVVLETIWVVANFKETQLAGMEVGQPVTFTVDALKHASFSGHIERFSPAAGSEFSVLKADNATGNFTKVAQRVPVRIAIDPSQTLAHRLCPRHVHGGQRKYRSSGCLAERCSDWRWGAPLGRCTGSLARHDIEHRPPAAVPGLSDELAAAYDGATPQAFSELGYRIDTAAVQFEPFANLAHVHLRTQDFAEEGGDAALSGTFTWPCRSD